VICRQFIEYAHGVQTHERQIQDGFSCARRAVRRKKPRAKSCAPTAGVVPHRTIKNFPENFSEGDFLPSFSALAKVAELTAEFGFDDMCRKVRGLGLSGEQVREIYTNHDLGSTAAV
jgi:hypothetical protein